jgi:Domain of Unknown Function (DUF928)
MFTQNVQIALAIALIFTSLSSYSGLAQIHPRMRVSQTLPTPPDTPPPPNHRTPAGGLDPKDRSCKDTIQPLTALIPEREAGKTTSDRPTFWFYVPYTAEEIRIGKFLLLDRDEKSYISQTAFTLPQTPGIISISLPPGYPLEDNSFYHWYLELYCQPNTSDRPDLEVDGWIERVPKTSDLQHPIDPEIPNLWYDVLTDLGNQRLAFPEDENLKDAWTNLLQSVGLEALDREPLAGAVQSAEN